jgi:hypothetical protein
VKHGFKVAAAVVLMVSAAALAMPASWMDVSAGVQAQPAPVAVRTSVAMKANDNIVAPTAVVRRSTVDIPEELSLLLVGAALVGLAALLRRDPPEEHARRGLRRSHISGVAAPRGLPRANSPRRSS